MFETLALGSLAGFLVACGVLFLTALAQNDLGRFEVTRYTDEGAIEIESMGTCPHCGGEVAGMEESTHEQQVEQRRAGA